MDLTGSNVTGEPLPGNAEMRELALSALAALERANLADAARAVQERVLGRSADALLEAYEENNVQRWRFKPMAELVLRELKCLAEVKHVPLDQRRLRVKLTLDIAGF